MGKAVTYEDGVIISTTKMHVITPSSGQFVDGDGQPVTPELVTMIAMQIHNGSPNPVYPGREVSATIEDAVVHDVHPRRGVCTSTSTHRLKCDSAQGRRAPGAASRPDATHVR